MDSLPLVPYPPTLTDPDKLGLLIQCRMKMDKLNNDQLYNYAHSTIKLLSTKQLKKLLFVGFNSIKNDIEYNQLFNMKSSLNQIIENGKKLKKNKSKQKPKATVKKPTIPIIPKNASLTKTIPFDIISNNICPFLKMSSITNLARCDRKLAIICHTPTSIKNLMHRYDPYRYSQPAGVEIDGYFTNMENWTVSNIHKFKNIDQLSITLNILERPELFNVFQKVQHLTFYPDKDACNSDLYQVDRMRVMPLLQTISFVSYYGLGFFLDFLDDETCNFNKSIHALTSIVFVDTEFDSLPDEGLEPDDDAEKYEQYKNITNFLLPSQSNNLEVLKFENSYFARTIHPKCTETNNEFANIERIKTSLSNLKGFVFAQSASEYVFAQSAFLTLTTNILSNLVLFSKLESIHTHSSKHDTAQQLLLLYLNNNNLNALHKVSELCISVRLKTMNQTMHSLKTFVPNLEKLCLVIKISDKAHLTVFERGIRDILVNLGKLKVLQIVALVEDDVRSCRDSSFCIKKIRILTELTKELFNAFIWIRNNSKRNGEKQQLLFKFHIKSAHIKSAADCVCRTNAGLGTFEDRIQSMILNYLVTYPLGKIQFKLSWNILEHFWLARKLRRFMKGLDGLFTVCVKDGGSLIDAQRDYHVNDMDYVQYAVSVTKQYVNKKVDHEKRWKVDCRYCCNTPWV